jgi:hypothetical protein
MTINGVNYSTALSGFEFKTFSGKNRISVTVTPSSGSGGFRAYLTNSTGTTISGSQTGGTGWKCDTSSTWTKATSCDFVGTGSQMTYNCAKKKFKDAGCTVDLTVPDYKANFYNKTTTQINTEVTTDWYSRTATGTKQKACRGATLCPTGYTYYIQPAIAISFYHEIPRSEICYQTPTDTLFRNVRYNPPNTKWNSKTRSYDPEGVDLSYRRTVTQLKIEYIFVYSDKSINLTSIRAQKWDDPNENAEFTNYVEDIELEYVGIYEPEFLDKYRAYKTSETQYPSSYASIGNKNISDIINLQPWGVGSYPDIFHSDYTSRQFCATAYLR